MSKFNSELCNKSMSFQECELAILRQAVDDAETTQGKNIATNSEVLRMISILETFLKRKRCICYGGTAINNILPKQAQFYDKDIEIPDYDFYSPNPLDDAKELADIYADEGFLEVEAKAGVHHGTYKVYVNFIAIADITLLHPTLFNSIEKDSIKVNGGVIITRYLFLFLSLEVKELILLSILIDFGTPNIFQFPIKYLIICLNLKFNL